MKNPDIKKYRDPGKFLKAKFYYLKEMGVFKTVLEASTELGYDGRGRMYGIFHNKISVVLSRIKIYKKVFQLTKEEEEFLILLVSLNNSETPLQRKIFKQEINKRVK